MARDLEPMTLRAGEEYVIGASGFFGTTGDLHAGAVPVSAFSMDPSATFFGTRGSGEAEEIHFPGMHFEPGSPTTFGANFQRVVVPEPSVVALLAPGGLLGLAVCRGAS